MKILTLFLLTAAAHSAVVSIRPDGVFLFDGKAAFPIGFTTAPAPWASAPSGGDAYAELAKPSSYVKPMTYGSVAPGLFDAIVVGRPPPLALPHNPPTAGSVE